MSATPRRPSRPARRPAGALFAADTPVAAALDRWPAAAEVFLRHRMACIGCTMARFDTLGEAATTYQLAVESFLAELAASTTHPRSTSRRSRHVPDPRPAR